MRLVVSQIAKRLQFASPEASPPIGDTSWSPERKSREIPTSQAICWLVQNVVFVSGLQWSRRSAAAIARSVGVSDCNPLLGLQPTPLWVSIFWDVVFRAINLFQSWRLYLECRPIHLTAEEEEIRRLAFADLQPRKVLQILSIGSWTTRKTGERLIERGRLSTWSHSLSVGGYACRETNESSLT